MAVDRWWYRGIDLYNAYDTDQKFTDDEVFVRVPSVHKGNYLLDDTGEIIYKDVVYDMRATYSFVSPYILNAVKLREQLINKLENLSSLKTGAKITRPTDGGILRRAFLTNKLSYVFLICVVPLSAYGLMRETKEIKHAQVLPQDKPVIQKQVAKINNEVLQNENVLKADLDLDHFQSLLPGSVLRFQSFVSDGHTYYANLRIRRGDLVELVTLDDLRLNGYWVTKEKRYIVISKDDFKIRIRI